MIKGISNNLFLVFHLPACVRDKLHVETGKIGYCYYYKFKANNTQTKEWLYFSKE